MGKNYSKKARWFRSILLWAPPSLLFAVLLFQVTVRIEVLRFGYELENLRSHSLELDVKLRELKLMHAKLGAPSEIMKRAEKELALRPTPPQNLRKILVDSQHSIYAKNNVLIKKREKS